MLRLVTSQHGEERERTGKLMPKSGPTIPIVLAAIVSRRLQPRIRRRLREVLPYWPIGAQANGALKRWMRLPQVVPARGERERHTKFRRHTNLPNDSFDLLHYFATVTADGLPLGGAQGIIAFTLVAPILFIGDMRHN